MKNLLSSIFLQSLLIVSHLSGIIIETPHFADILNHVKPNSLVILDIDDTLIIPSQTLGSDVWFMHQHKKYLGGYEPEEALDRALAEWQAIRHLTKMELVEEGTDQIIRDLQNQNITLMCLTTQGLSLATQTAIHLYTVGIDPSTTAPSLEDHYFVNRHGVLYRHGILFTSGTPKGHALTTLFELIDLHPEHVVFINDKASHLKDLEAGLATKKISFTGLRYSYSDDRVNNFDPELADYQWNHSTLGNIISDEDARALLSQEKQLAGRE